MAASRGRTDALRVVHAITMATALAGTLAYATFELRNWSVTGATAAIARGLVALGVAAGIGVYLRTFGRRWVPPRR